MKNLDLIHVPVEKVSIAKENAASKHMNPKNFLDTGFKKKKKKVPTREKIGRRQQKNKGETGMLNSGFHMRAFRVHYYQTCRYERSFQNTRGDRNVENFIRFGTKFNVQNILYRTNFIDEIHTRYLRKNVS